MEMKHTRDNQSNLLIYLRTELNSPGKKFCAGIFPRARVFTFSLRHYETIGCYCFRTFWAYSAFRAKND